MYFWAVLPSSKIVMEIAIFALAGGHRLIPPHHISSIGCRIFCRIKKYMSVKCGPNSTQTTELVNLWEFFNKIIRMIRQNSSWSTFVLKISWCPLVSCDVDIPFSLGPVFPPTRWALTKFALPSPGQGPSRKTMEDLKGKRNGSLRFQPPWKQWVLI